MASVKISILLPACSFGAGFFMLIRPIFSNFAENFDIMCNDCNDNMTKKRQREKMNPTVKKTISAILLLLLMSSFYGAIIALCNQYLRRHDLISPLTKSFLIALLIIGFYLIYRWFSKRIDDLSNKKAECGR